MESRSRQRRVHRLEFDIEWPPGHVACYLVDGPEPVLVDTAFSRADDGLERAVSEHGRELEEIEHVLITHPHIDHVDGVPEILEATDPTVYAPATVRERFNRDPDALGERVRRNCLDAGFDDDQTQTAVDMAVTSLERNVELLAPDVVDVWVEPNEPTAVGGLTVDPIHLPGHQADHLAYSAEIDDERVLLAGDMGISPFRSVVMHDGLDDGYREAFDAFYTAVDRMEALDVDRVYPCHGPVHTALPGVVERDRSSLDERLDQVVELVADGHETAPSIANALGGNHEVNYLIPEAMSALAHLESAGRLASERVDGVTHYDV